MQALLRSVERRLLMALQYDFDPEDPDPYATAASEAGIGEGEAVRLLRDLAVRGILKRVGYYLNYRSHGRVAALVAYATRGRARLVAEVYRGDPETTHVYLRDHPVYDLWVVVKRRSREELEAHVRGVAEEFGVDYVILYSRRTYKLSVKYDLERGISRSGRYAEVHPDPPRPEELGIPLGLARSLRSLPLVERPYKAIAAKHGLAEDEVIDAAVKLLRAGVLGDPGAALDGWRIGFRDNAMVVMEPGTDYGSLCSCVTRLPFTTHVVEREPVPPGAWRQNCYFMVHGVSRGVVDSAILEASETCRPRSLRPIRSLADLKPGVTR